jgi:hypothetical protein
MRIPWAVLLLIAISAVGRAQEPVSGAAPLTANERRHIIDVVVENVRRYYFDRALASRTADALRSHQAAGEYANKNGADFAALLTNHLREASGDIHLGVDYFPDPLPLHRPEPSPQDSARRRAQLEQINCTIARAGILPGNIGYLKFDFFPELSICAKPFAAALQAIDGADAVIFDLRDNRGGMPDTVSFVASYLFDQPQYLFNPREAPTAHSWTQSPVAGSHLAHKRAYILTSATTMSGAEEFSYNLKMLRRATLIGERTAGATHSGVFHRIDAHFGMGIPEVKSLNPYGKQDWEGIGVEPDLKVSPSDALETAKKIAMSNAY